MGIVAVRKGPGRWSSLASGKGDLLAGGKRKYQWYRPVLEFAGLEMLGLFKTQMSDRSEEILQPAE